ncbi:Kinesin-4 [Acorus calamus]|uniref:Kinesin-4 n=1 Tax=Acorus calamus TaxID=4465 RepID=A0AAV9EUE0_ACOCL|nr:Kinesin-4 [Acorus calamus]
MVQDNHIKKNINDELVLRKAEEAACRRFQATKWLREMDRFAAEVLPSKEPSEEEFCLALRNGLILCNVLNRVNPGAVSKVVECPVFTVESTDGAAQSAIQYFENMRNFLVAVGEMKLLTFEASDLEKGGSSSKVVDCILCLKGYHEWKQSGGIGIWKYGGIVKITSSNKCIPPSILGRETVTGSSQETCSPYDECHDDHLRLLSESALEESGIGGALVSLFDRFGLKLLREYLTDLEMSQLLPLNGMIANGGVIVKGHLMGMMVDIVTNQAVEQFYRQLESQSCQLGLMLKRALRGDKETSSKAEFLEAVSGFLDQQSYARSDCSRSSNYVERLDLQQHQIDEIKLCFHDAKVQVRQIESKWEEEVSKLVIFQGTISKALNLLHLLTTKCSRKIVFSYNQVQDLKEQVYADTQPLIRSVLDGYNVCIFAYGQTGSGKTYTMTGPDLSMEETWGVNYRSLKDLFKISRERRDAIRYEVSVQMIEIYNEQSIYGQSFIYPFEIAEYLFDLTSSTLEIRNNSQQNGLNIPDASLVSVRCTRDVFDLMRIGLANRAVGATALNVRSSRSHSVLTVHVQGKELVSGSTLRGCLHLVDLAGSERVNKSEAVGERLKEAQHINKSLSALGDVIFALAQKSSHIPYRNSKLTQVLQDALGGQAKTLMFVHINPDVHATGETISTLKFAERVASIELGAAHANKETGELRELREEVAKLKSVLERKETQMEQLKVENMQYKALEVHKTGFVSPLQSRTATITLKSEVSRRSIDGARNNEMRTSSSGKQRRFQIPPGSTEDDRKLPLRQDTFMNSRKLRSPSPPVSVPLSTDQGTHIKNKCKPTSTCIDATSVLPTNENTRRCWDLPEKFHMRPENPKKVHPEHEEENQQNVIRRDRLYNKTKPNQQLLPLKSQKPELTLTCRVVNLEPQNEEKTSHVLRGFFESPRCSTSRLNKVQGNSVRMSYNKSRDPMQRVESLSAGKHENKPPNAAMRDRKEGVADLRRSRSLPRGKFTNMP